MHKLQLLVISILFFLITGIMGLRKRRALLFPPTAPTRMQLIYGIGIPLPLEYESMTTGYVLKAEYFLPTNATEWRPLQLNPQSVSKREVAFSESEDFDTNNNDNYDDRNTLRYIRRTNHERQNNGNLGKYRWGIYKTIEVAASRAGLEGRACMLRCICEAAEAPFHYHSGLLAELMHIILTPSTSADPLSKHSDNEYFHAEYLGKSGAPCDVVFKECTKSILSIFSGTYNTPANLVNYLFS